MEKKVKIRVIVCSVLAVICFFLYVILGFFVPEEKEQLLMPSSGLSQSVFESQNLIYSSLNGLTVQNPYKNIPFMVDTVDAKKATVGRGNFYNYEPYYFYYSELPREAELADMLKNEVTDVLSLSATEGATAVEVLTSQQGYVNGCAATFYVLSVTSDDGIVGYMCLYRLSVDASIYVSTWDMVVGCMVKANSIDTATLSDLQELTYASVGTLRYNEAQAEYIEKAKQ